MTNAQNWAYGTNGNSHGEGLTKNQACHAAAEAAERLGLTVEAYECREGGEVIEFEPGEIWTGSTY